MTSFNFPVVLTPQGLQPQAPADILTQLIADVASQVPGYTATLPGSLIEDVSSTDVAAISLCDQAKVELVNSITPFGANEFIMLQLGQIYLGQGPGQPTNTSVPVVFSGPVGQVIANGFLVGDGTNNYQVQGGTVIGSSGHSPTVTAISVAAGSFAVPPNTVTLAITTIPGVTITVNNSLSGNPGGTTETPYAFRMRVLQAGLASSIGTTRFIKTLVGLVLGSQANLISVQQAGGTGLRVVVGGSADIYQIANAIFNAVSDIAMLVGSAVNSTRNVTVSLIDYPDAYKVLYVAAPQQTVTMVATWNTVLTSFTGGGAFPGLVQQPLTDYINGLGIGQVINILEMNEIFQEAVAAVLDPSSLTRLVFTVSINGTPVAPATGTYAVSGDPESYFFAVPTGIIVNQG